MKYNIFTNYEEANKYVILDFMKCMIDMSDNNGYDDIMFTSYKLSNFKNKSVKEVLSKTFADFKDGKINEGQALQTYLIIRKEIFIEDAIKKCGNGFFEQGNINDIYSKVIKALPSDYKSKSNNELRELLQNNLDINDCIWVAGRFAEIQEITVDNEWRHDEGGNKYFIYPSYNKSLYKLETRDLDQTSFKPINIDFE